MPIIAFLRKRGAVALIFYTLGIASVCVTLPYVVKVSCKDQKAASEISEGGASLFMVLFMFGMMNDKTFKS